MDLLLFVLMVLCICMIGSIDGEALKSYTSHWPPQRWQEYEPLLSYCRDNGVRIVACGTPLAVHSSILYTFVLIELAGINE